MVYWHFAEQRLDDVDDETTVSKNFARESRRLAGVFVREFFQNVLDARTEVDGCPSVPHVRIAFQNEASGLSVPKLNNYLDGLHAHLESAGHVSDLWEDARANVLVLEEFNTTGLIGETENSRARGPNERWANFWFGEGKRSKRGASLGRAGQGKITYHLISGTQSIFALTSQAESGNKLLFGKCIVQTTHKIGTSYFKRHGYWPEIGEGRQPLPCTRKADLQDFAEVFKLSRTDQSGTSWVIPFVDQEAFSKERLIGEVLRDFFFSIMAGELTVDVMGVRIDKSNIAETLNHYPIKDLPVNFIHFLQEAITLPDQDPSFILVGDNWYGAGTEAPMQEDSVAQADIERARAALDRSGLISVKLPVPITLKGGKRGLSEIKVFIKKPEDIEKSEEIYVRSGLVIGEEQHLRNAPGRYYGLMRATEKSISEFLGFAEEASHMKWNTREPAVLERYSDVPNTIARVRHSLPKVAKLLLGHSSGRHDDALINFLSIPASDGKGSKTKTKKKRKKQKDGVEDPTKIKVERSVLNFLISQTGSQWQLLPGEGAKNIEYPKQIRIHLAYATMRGEGDPFKAYHHFEFDLADEEAFPVEVQGGYVLARDLNRLDIELVDPEFWLKVKGFAEHALKSRIRELAIQGDV